MAEGDARTAFAHSKEGWPREDWEPLRKHLEEVAQLAAEFADAFGAAEWGRLAGLWHDLGKYSDAFQGYLRGASKQDGGDEHAVEVTGRVDHSTAGAQHAARLGPLGRLLAYVIAGHHAGLADDVGGAAGLSERLKKSIDLWDAAPADLLERSLPVPPTLDAPAERRRRAFSIAFFTRMVFSCLVDADFLATERFMAPGRAAARPRATASLAQLSEQLDRHLKELEARATESPVNDRRREVLAACRARAGLAPGLFSLHVPTGGGKTLSSLAFALRHAVRHGLRRVIYAIPFTSIIEQTTCVFRNALGPLGGEVLEHHSNLDPDDPFHQSTRSRLAAENFDAPIVVTTNVQFFESLFASRTSRCRKLHRLARAVIILDEAQTVPPTLLAPALAALEELTRNYGCTVVLCTATQPAVERRPGFSVGLDNITPIVEDPALLHRVLRRAKVDTVGHLADEALIERLRRERQALCIVNSRGHGAALFRLLNDPDALHLSASLCGAHRTDVLTEILRRLKSRAPCRVICTQVIEAGVDVDFPVVFRAVSGLDSIAQAAGRCNREGSLRDAGGRAVLGRVFVFEYDDVAHRPPPFVRRAAGHFRELYPAHADDVLAPSAVEAYFRLHYWQQGGDGGVGWDRGRGGASVLRCFGGEDGNPLHHQFREGTARFQLIDDVQVPVLVPYDTRGRRLTDELAAMREAPGVQFDRAAQRYIVPVWNQVLRRLKHNGSVVEVHGRHYLANVAAYDTTLSSVGLRADLEWDPGDLVQ